MFPKIRNPLSVWILTIVTGGIYAFYWVSRVTGEINSAEKKMIFRITHWRWIFFALLILCFLGAVLAKYHVSFMPFITAFLATLLFAIYIQISLGNYIKSKQKELIGQISYSNILSVLLFWLVANSGIAYMQTAINHIIRLERG